MTAFLLIYLSLPLTPAGGGSAGRVTSGGAAMLGAGGGKSVVRSK